MSKFVNVIKWNWNHYFLGTRTIFTNTTTTKEQVENWIEKSTNGGSGNWNKDSLTKELVKCKEKKADLTIIN